MKILYSLFTCLLLQTAIASISNQAHAQKTDTRYYELRIYYCNPGKLNALKERFANHTTKLFEKHGMQNIGYWLPADNKDSALYYVLAFPNKAGRDSSWKAFGNDPEWVAVRNRSEENGKLLTKITSVFMEAAAFTPAIKPSHTKTDRVFELRTYTCLPDKLPDLLNRFRDHTVRLINKHGITNIAYWTTIPADSTQPKLVYLVAHPAAANIKPSWDAFDTDPNWLAAKAASETNGKIVAGIESITLTPLPFSRIR
jgi:hypothetical protein